MHLRLQTTLPGDAADRAPVVAVVLELGEGLDGEGLRVPGILGLLHVVEVDLLDVHRVVLLQHRLCLLDQPRHRPFKHVLLACLPVLKESIQCKKQQ